MKLLLLFLSLGITSLSLAQINPSDGCAGVPSLPVNVGCVPNNYTLPGTYANGGLALSVGCIAGNDRDDGWYSFVATSTSTTIELSGNEAKFAVVWSACGGGTEIGCQAAGIGATATLIVPTAIGTTYYIQVHRRSGTGTATMTGTICVYQTPLSPGCAPNTVIASLPYVATGFNTAGAGDDFSSASVCGSTYMNGDDYTFTYTPVGNECVSIALTNTATWVGVFITNGCPSAPGSFCVASGTASGGNPSITSATLLAGQTYYFTVSTWPAPQSTPFDISVTNCPPPPVNDEPCGAIVLPVNVGSCAYSTQILPTNATASAGIPVPGCSSLGPDVWFQVTVPAGGLIIDLTTNGGPTDMGMAWYTGPNCGNLNTLISCDDDDSQNGAMPMICHAGSNCNIPGNCQQSATLTPGTTVWVRIWEYGGGTFGGFDICAYSPLPAGSPVTCANATIIPSVPYFNAGSTCCASNTYTSANGCLSSYQNGEDFLYSYTPLANQIVDINLTGTLGYTGVFVTNGCPSGGTCVSSATSTGGNPSLCGVSLTAGVTYYIMVDTQPTPNCTPFNLTIAPSSAPTCNLNYTYAGGIPFAPDPNAGTLLPIPTDDRFSTTYVPLGFNFCFDGYQFNQALLSTNGYLIFDPISCATNLPGGLNASPSAYSAWSINAAIPNTTNAPRNSIMFPWQDIDPSVGGTIRYQVLGTAPNRRFVITFNNIPYFSCNSLLFTGQLKLFETTNNIEMHITRKETCGAWNGGAGIFGLHNYNGTQAVLGVNYPTQTTFTNQASRYTYNCPGPCINPVQLPIDLASFDGTVMDDHNLISWSTYIESNNDQFVVEHSEDGIHFEAIGYVSGAGNSTELTLYNFRHDNPDGLEYYRLKQIDFDGAYEYSNIIALSRRRDGGIQFFPNPSSSRLYLSLTEGLEGTYTLVYTDVFGHSIQEEIQLNKSMLSYEALAFEQLGSGVYMIQLIGSDEIVTTQKVVKE